MFYIFYIKERKKKCFYLLNTSGKREGGRGGNKPIFLFLSCGIEIFGLIIVYFVKNSTKIYNVINHEPDIKCRSPRNYSTNKGYIFFI